MSSAGRFQLPRKETTVAIPPAKAALPNNSNPAKETIAMNDKNTPQSPIQDPVARLEAYRAARLSGDIEAIRAAESAAIRAARGNAEGIARNILSDAYANLLAKADPTAEEIEEAEARAFAEMVRLNRRAPDALSGAAPAAGAGWFDPAILGSLKPVQFVIPGRIPQGGVTIIAGRPDLGKSAMICAAACAVATGRSEILGIDDPMVPGRAGILGFEDDLRNTAQRIGALMLRWNIPPEQMSEKIDLRFEGGIETLRSMAAECDIVFVDPLVFFVVQSNEEDGGDRGENDNVGMAKLVGEMKNIAADHDVAIASLHHMKKLEQGIGEHDDFDHIRGASSIAGSIRSALLVRSHKHKAMELGVPEDEARDIIRLVHVKSNWSAKADTLYFKRRSHEWRAGLKHYQVVVEPTALPEGEDLTARDEADAETVLPVIRDLPPQERRISLKSAGWIGKAIGNALGVGFRDEVVNARIKGLIAHMEASRQLQRVPWTDPKGKTGEIWEAAQ